MAFFFCLLFVASAHAQNDIITPRFVPAQTRIQSEVVPAIHHEVPIKMVPVAGQRPVDAPITIVPVAAQRPADGGMRAPVLVDEGDVSFIRPELPGPQRLFMRDSEADFFDRLSRAMKKNDGTRAIFPDDPVVSKETYRPRNFPHMVQLVEPSFVCHGRLYFEQPNFERAGYNFGVLQPAICLGVFYYDMALLPYHMWTDLHNREECNVGKCLPGDQSPLLFPRERFSVTGLVGAAGTGIGLGFLFP